MFSFVSVVSAQHGDVLFTPMILDRDGVMAVVNHYLDLVAEDYNARMTHIKLMRLSDGSEVVIDLDRMASDRVNHNMMLLSTCID